MKIKHSQTKSTPRAEATYTYTGRRNILTPNELRKRYLMREARRSTRNCHSRSVNAL